MSKRLEEIYQRGLNALELSYAENIIDKETKIADQYTEPLKLRIPKRKKAEK